MISKKLGPYEIVEKLGEGGMGVVYRARDERLKRDVALKLLPPELTADLERKQRFAQKARAASALNRPNIVAIYDIVSKGGGDCIVTEYVAGKTLSQKIGRKGLPFHEVLQLAIQIAEALAAAHAAGIVHRDIEPGNIMVTIVDTVDVREALSVKRAGCFFCFPRRHAASTVSTKSIVSTFL